DPRGANYPGRIAGPDRPGPAHESEEAVVGLFDHAHTLDLADAGEPDGEPVITRFGRDHDVPAGGVRDVRPFRRRQSEGPRYNVRRVRRDLVSGHDVAMHVARPPDEARSVNGISGNSPQDRTTTIVCRAAGAEHGAGDVVSNQTPTCHLPRRQLE